MAIEGWVPRHSQVTVRTTQASTVTSALIGSSPSRWEGHSAEESKAQGAKELAGEVAGQGADPVWGAMEPGISAVLCFCSTPLTVPRGTYL